jgi:hypothetical protein
MASQLSNLRRTLTWNDFGTPVRGPDPAAGVVATAAQTRATHSHSINSENVPGSSPAQFRLQDSVTLSVILQRNQMFVNAWVFRRPQTFQDTLLHHEQGHYDLVALFCRDMFIEIMAVKPQTFASNNAVMQAVEPIMTRFDALIAAVHTPYDNDAQHGRNVTQQQRWDAFIQSAFTTPRDPPMSAPDGAAYKTPLAGVLRAGGVQI